MIKKEHITSALLTGLGVCVLAGAIACAPSGSGSSTAAQGASSSRTPVSGSAATTGMVGSQPVAATHVLAESAKVPAPGPGQKKVVLEQLGMT